MGTGGELGATRSTSSSLEAMEPIPELVLLLAVMAPDDVKGLMAIEIDSLAMDSGSPLSQPSSTLFFLDFSPSELSAELDLSLPGPADWDRFR